MWVPYAILSAIFAAAVAIFGKIGLKGIDSTLATTVRSVIMALFLLTVALSMGKFSGWTFETFGSKAWLMIALSGIAGALSWLFYFVAIKNGNVTAVAAIDRLSIVFVILLSALFLGEALTWKTGAGALLVALGAFLIVWK
jgi:transporter family protein